MSHSTLLSYTLGIICNIDNCDIQEGFVLAGDDREGGLAEEPLPRPRVREGQGEGQRVSVASQTKL